jgi:D-3-phosphoglycerate dehydrogenase / 2-oxoglutarate reductase
MKVALLDDFHSLISSSFLSWGWEVVDAKNWTEEYFRQNCKDLDGVVIRSKFPLYKENLKFANRLKFIARPGAGLENIDLAYCTKKNIKVFRSPEGNRDAVAEHVVGMLIMLLANIKKADNEVRQAIWKREENRGSELMGKVFAIIGYGYMGKALAQRLSGFGMSIIAYDKYISGFGSDTVKEVKMEEVFKTADFVSLHTPLSDETKGMVNTTFIEKFKKSFYFINTARGQSVLTKDLVAALKSKKISGACLDVFDVETSSFEKVFHSNDIAFKELLNLDNVILSPHIAGWTHESKFKMAQVIVDKLKTEFYSAINNE